VINFEFIIPVALWSLSVLIIFCKKLVNVFYINQLEALLVAEGNFYDRQKYIVTLQ
jgi:hypothetical protein